MHWFHSYTLKVETMCDRPLILHHTFHNHTNISLWQPMVNSEATMAMKPKQCQAAWPWAATSVTLAEEIDLRVFQGYI